MITEMKSNGFMYSEFFKENMITYNMMPELMKKEHKAFVSPDPCLIAVLGVKKALWVCVESDVTTAGRSSLLSELIEKTAGSSVETFASDTQTAVVLKKLFKPDRFTLRERLVSYSCKAAMPVNVIRGRMRKVSAKDSATVNQLINLFFLQYYGAGTAGSQSGEPTKLMKTNDFYLWEDRGKAVAMAAVTCKSHGQARINYVYVDEKSRNMGYGKMLVSSLCRLLLNEGLTPVLYSKQNDKTANKMYAGSGFEKGGGVDVYYGNL